MPHSPPAQAVRLPRRFGLKLRRFGADRGGATAVEFGLIAAPFLGLLFAILETALVFFAGQTIETAVSRAARLIRTGQAQQQNMSAAEFKTEVCGFMASLFNCANELMVDVRTYATFGDIDLTDPIDENGNLVQNFTYAPGAGGELVVVRAFYEWPIFVNILGRGMTNLANGSRLLASTAAFRNEPF